MTGEELLSGVEPPAPQPTVPRMLPPMPTPPTQPMPPPAGTSDIMKYQFLCATYGVCPAGVPNDAPKLESTGPLLSPRVPSSDQPEQASEAERKP
jgi:hypothetical protein